MNRLTQIEPERIEQRSFQIIESEFYSHTSIDPKDLDPKVFRVIQRVIHATGDFSFANTLTFHDRSLSAGITSIRKGRNIYCDVGMATSGVSEKLLSRHGGKVICHLNDPSITQKAQEEGKTRTETALEKIVDDNIGTAVEI